jgi:hypothetical protein
MLRLTVCEIRSHELVDGGIIRSHLLYYIIDTAIDFKSCVK